MRRGNGSGWPAGTSSNKAGQRRAARRPQHGPANGDFVELLTLLKVLGVFLAGAAVCLLLTVVTTIVAVTLFFCAPAPESSRLRRSRWQSIKLQLRMAPQRLFTVFALRRPLTEDTAWYALRLEAGATDAPLPEEPETVASLPLRAPAAQGHDNMSADRESARPSRRKTHENTAFSCRHAADQPSQRLRSRKQWIP